MFRVVWGGGRPGERESRLGRGGVARLGNATGKPGVGKALSVLFTCRRASSLAHSANGEPALGVGPGKKWAFPGWPGSGSHPDLHHAHYRPIPIAGPTHLAAALSKPACLLSREDPGLADDRGIVWQPQKPPLASRRRGNWHRRLREQEMSGRRPRGAGSCSVSSALSGNRLPNYRALPATPNSCRLPAAPLPGVLTASRGLGGHLLPLPERTRQLPRERPALIATIQVRSTGAPPPPARPGIQGSSHQVQPSSPPADCPGRALPRAAFSPKCQEYSGQEPR